MDISALISERQYQIQLDAATTQVSKYITRIAENLDVECKGAPPRPDINLTDIRARRPRYR